MSLINQNSRRLWAAAGIAALMVALVGTRPAAAAPLAPTVEVPDGADGWVNASEAPALTVEGTYQSLVGITQIRVWVAEDLGASCGPAILGPVDLNVDGISGSWSHAFDVSSLAEGTALCGAARAFDGAYSPEANSAERPVLDTVAPGAGTLTLDDGGDGFVSAAEADAGVPYTWAAGTGSPSEALLRFSDAGGVTPPSSDCGLFVVGPSGGGTLSQQCADALADGTVVLRGVWNDEAKNASPETTVSSTLDRAGPGAGVAEMLDLNGDGYLNLDEATTSCCIPANWSNTSGGIASTELRFVDSTAATPTGCGPFFTGASGSGGVNATCAANMAQGTFSFEARWFDPAGNVSLAFDTLIKDTTLPAVQIFSPTAGSFVPTTFTASGVTEPQSTLEFFINGVAQPDLGQAGAGGEFSRTFTLAGGLTELKVRATDPASNVDEGIVTFTVDPLIPLIERPEQNSAQPGVVTITGTGKPDTTVEVFEGSTLVGSTEVNSVGNWELTSGMSDGPHTIRARGVEIGGAPVSTFSPERTFFVNPGPPTLTVETPDLAINPLQIRGTASDLIGVDRIEIDYFDALRGVKLASAEADCYECDDNAVTWVHRVPGTLAPGMIRADVTAYNTAGVASQTRTIRFLYVHDL